MGIRRGCSNLFLEEGFFFNQPVHVNVNFEVGAIAF